MKKLILTIATALLALSAYAQAPALKVAVIDMEKVFTGYKKVQAAEKQIKADIEKSANELQKRQSEGANLMKQLEELRKKQNNDALSADAREAAKKQARAIEDQLDQKETEFEKLREQSRKSLAEKNKTQREKIFKEIQSAAISVAKKQNATVIIDSSAEAANGFPSLIYADKSYDITSAVLQILNAGS